MSQPIWHRFLSCSSSDSCINDCQICPTNSSVSCDHSEDVAVSCSECWIATYYWYVQLWLSSYHSAYTVPNGAAEVSVCRFSGPHSCKFGIQCCVVYAICLSVMWNMSFQLHRAMEWFGCGALEIPPPLIPLDVSKSTTTIDGAVSVMTSSLDSMKLAWSAISWDMLEHPPSPRHLLISKKGYLCTYNYIHTTIAPIIHYLFCRIKNYFYFSNEHW